MTPHLTAEDAYWHACANVPIDHAPDLPDIESYGFDLTTSDYVWTLKDGVQIRLEAVAVQRLRKSSKQDLYDAVYDEYLRQRGSR